MANFGITAAQEGIDISEATDAQRVIDSRWRYMDIAFEEKISLPTLDNNRLNVFEHNLGYVPAFDCYSLSREAYIGTSRSLGSLAGVIADNRYIYFSGFFDTAGLDNSTALLRIYNIPIMEEYTAGIAQTLSKSKSKTSRYGVKILNPNKSGSMSDNDMTKYSLNTQSKSLAIHMTGTQTCGDVLANKIVIKHGLGNPPIFMATVVTNDLSMAGALTTDFMSAIAVADIGLQTLTFQGAQAALTGKYAYIIFKEFADFAQ